MTAARQRAINIIQLMPEPEVVQFVIKNARYEKPEKYGRNEVRIGVAKGKFKAPDDFDANNDEVYAMIMESASKL